MQLCEMVFDQLEIVVRDRRVPVELALIVRVEDAVVKTGTQSIFLAGSHERGYYVGFVAAGGDVVVVTFGIPQAEARHVLRREHRILCT